MFFYIGNSCPLKSLNKVASNIFVDKGWKTYISKSTQYFYKGYSLDCNLVNHIDDIVDGYKPSGKWVVLSSQGNIYHPVLRGFPLYKNDLEEYTNIPLENFHDAYYETVSIVRPVNKISIEEASIQINEILKENIHNFFKYNQIEKLRVLFSAGIDSLTVWSILDNLGYDYDLYIHEAKIKDIFGVKQEYESDLVDLCRKKFWGYKITSCFSKENWYLTGFYSERIQLREVTQGHAISNYIGKPLHVLPKKTDYLYHFLQRPDFRINKEPTLTNEQDLIDYCNYSVFYDHQMWHIDNNFHFSPFNDLRITQVINKLSLDDIIQNAFTAIIQKNIINMNRPDFLSILSDYKNSGDIWQNYRKNFKKLVLRDSIKQYIT